MNQPPENNVLGMQPEDRLLMQEERRSSAAERRLNDANTDRRSWHCQLDFPYIDGHGTLVTEDRRHIVERRIQYLEHMDGDRRKPLVTAFVQKN